MWQPIFMINGCLVGIMGLLMLVPAFFVFYENQGKWSPFFGSSLILIFIGFLMYLSNRVEIKKITLQQGYLLTVCTWFSLTFLAMLPFVLSGATLNFADALFEAASGISTTGATIMADVESQSRSILLWRSMLNAMGGVGVVIFAVAMLPFLGIGGMQIFHRENSDINDKILPKFSYIAKEIILIYVSLGVLCTVCLYLSGMSWFDAVNHAMTSVATGGFSTKNASIGSFDSLQIEVVLSIFMILGAIPMTFYIILVQHRDFHSLRSEQVIFFLKTLVFYILGTTLWLYFSGKYDFAGALRYSSFNIISIVTTTGYASTDYMLWGNLAYTLFIIFALTGGCTGSTSGSVKIFRWQVIIAYLQKSLRTAIEPNRVLPIKVGNINIDNGIVASVIFFMSAYIFCLLILTVLVAVTGVDFATAVGSVVACITNSGPGIGEVVGPAGNFSSLPDFAKYVLSFAMLLGRLDILTVLVVFTRSFWR